MVEMKNSMKGLEDKAEENSQKIKYGTERWNIEKEN